MITIRSLFLYLILYNIKISQHQVIVKIKAFLELSRVLSELTKASTPRPIYMAL